MKNFIIAFLLFAISPISFAWDGAHTSRQVNFIQMDGAYIYVTLKDVPTMCTGGNVWGVLEHNNPAHKSMLAALLAAKTTGNLVDMYSNVCTSPAGYCCIGNVLMR